MGKEYTKSQKEAMERYLEKTQIIRVYLPKEKAALINILAEAEGKKAGRYLLDHVDVNGIVEELFRDHPERRKQLEKFTTAATDTSGADQSEYANLLQWIREQNTKSENI